MPPLIVCLYILQYTTVSLEKEMATHSSILAWRYPWTEDLGGLQSMGLQSDTTKQLTHIQYPAAAAAKLLQLCLTLCNPIDGSPPGSPVPGILQARTLEWVAISFSSAWKWKGCWKGSHLVVSNSQPPHGRQPTRLLHPWDFPGKSTGVGCHCLLQIQWTS